MEKNNFLKKYYFDIFFNKNTLKNNYSYTFEYKKSYTKMFYYIQNTLLHTKTLFEFEEKK
jgi:hypothetical protein